MKYLLHLCCAVVFASLLISCTKTIYIPVEERRKETVIWHDTVVNVVQAGEMLYNKTIDTVSVLQAHSASSTAIVADGVLSHSLTVHPRSDSVVVKWREVYVVDSVPYPVPVVDESHRVTTRLCRTTWLIVGAILLIGAILYRFGVKLRA